MLCFSYTCITLHTQTIIQTGWEMSKYNNNKKEYSEIKSPNSGQCNFPTGPKINGKVHYLVNEVLHTALQTPPAEMHSHQLIRSHIGTVTVMKLFLQKKQRKAFQSVGKFCTCWWKEWEFACVCTFHPGPSGPLPVFSEWKRAGSSSGL